MATYTHLNDRIDQFKRIAKCTKYKRNSKSLISDVSGLYFWVVIARPGVSNALDNPTYKTITLIQKLQ
ncbi:hypothetical protein T12_14083 [Trichinella patagoniensis]|uniref:Uncharacterized protein n=1 Tax=Trichinella patagoniensis TaxID=990121 RepID=A0A0V0YY70_9BILA|nr:hypothetical protein T12_14083 [Trichinella patagoniensis]